LYAEEEISVLINESNKSKIVAAIKERKIPMELRTYFIRDVLYSKDSVFSDSLLENSDFLNLISEVNREMPWSLWIFVQGMVEREREFAVVKLLSIFTAKIPDNNSMPLFKIACEKGMTTVAEYLLANTNVYQEMLKEAKAQQKSNGRSGTRPPEAFCKAVEHGHTKIVELLLPCIIAIEGCGWNYWSRMLKESRDKDFVKIVELLRTLPDVKALELANKFSKLAEDRDLAGIRGMIEAGFDDLGTMYSTLRKSIAINDYPIFEYLLSITSLREAAIKWANNQSTNGALHGNRWAYRLGANCINDAAKAGSIEMLSRFIDIDPNAVSNSGALLYAVDGDTINSAMFNLLLEKTKFKLSRSMMYAITSLIVKGANNTLDKVLAKFAAQAENQDELNKTMQEIVCAVIDDAGAYYRTADRVLPILQFPTVRTAIGADEGCTVLKELIRYGRAFDRAILERIFNDYLESGKVRFEAQKKNEILYLAVSSVMGWVVDTLLTIPEVMESLNKNHERVSESAKNQLSYASHQLEPKAIESLKKRAEHYSQTKQLPPGLSTAEYIANEIKELQSNMATAEYIANKIQAAISTPAEVKPLDKRLRQKHKL